MKDEINSIFDQNGNIVIKIDKKINKDIYDEFKDFDYHGALAHLFSLMSMKKSLFANPGHLKLFRKIERNSLSELSLKYLKQLKKEIVTQVTFMLSKFDYTINLGLYDLDKTIGINENNILSMLIHYSKSLKEINDELDKRSPK